MALEKTVEIYGQPTTRYHHMRSVFCNPSQQGLVVEVASWPSAEARVDGLVPVTVRSVTLSADKYGAFDIDQPVRPQVYALLKEHDETLAGAADLI